MQSSQTGAGILQWTAISAIAGYLLLAIPLFSQQHRSGSAQLLITPSTASVPIGETSTLSAVDEKGRPLSNVHWSLSSSIANLQEQDGAVFVQGREAGRAILTATSGGQSASATISVVQTEKPGPVVRWSLEPISGFETLLLVQTASSANGPAFYSIEWSKSEKAIVRALSPSGQQLWLTHLASTAEPSALRHRVQDPSQVWSNQTLVSDHSSFIIGVKTAFFENHDPNSSGLPAQGTRILLRATGNASDGIILLERSRLNDSLVALNPADGSELWRYESKGRLARNWTVNWNMQIGIVETIANPISSALLILNAETGQVDFHIPFPISSSTIDGFRCTDPHRTVLKNLRPSRAGSVLTAEDGNIYVQVETHVESLLVQACKNERYVFDNTLSLLRVTPEGETEWKTFQNIHAEGNGDFVAQPRVFAGETIPDGFGGVLAAWTYLSPHVSDGHINSEARVTRIDSSSQRDFNLPMPYWTKDINSPFDANMVLGEGNVLYATNGLQVVRLKTESGEVDWVRQAPSGEVKIDHSTAGGGLLVANAGRLVYLTAEGNGAFIPWTAEVSNAADIGLSPTDPIEKNALEPLQLRELQFCWSGNFIGIEDGPPYGHGTLLYIAIQ